MISEEYKKLARWALKYALDNGCSDARISVYSGTDNSFEYRDTQLDKLEQSFVSGIGIQLYVDGRFSSYSTNRLEKTELKQFISDGINATRYLAKDEFRKLPDLSRCYQGNGDDLDLYDPAIDKITIDEKLRLVKENVEEVSGLDSRLITAVASYSDETTHAYVINSKGFEGESATTYYSLSAETSVKGVGDVRPASYWYDSAICWDKLQKSGIGEKALKRTLQKLGQEKITSGSFKMLLDNTQSQRLFSPLISAIYGSSIQQKTSFLLDKIGERVFSERLTITDDPHLHNARGARWFDGEGVATRKMQVIENGVLKMYYLDTYYAGKLNKEPTIQSPSILLFERGDKDFDQLLSSLDRGIWVTDFNGGNSNPTTGDFSFGIEGFLIENGQIIKPLNEMNITGNLIVLWQNLLDVGNDPKTSSSWRIPSLLFDEVRFSGKSDS